MSITKHSRGAAIVAGVLAAGALAAPAAQAQSAPTTASVASGQTMLRLDPAAASALRSLGVSVRLGGGARVGASGLTFPVTGGTIDPRTLAGTVTHRGSITFRAGNRRLTVTSPTYRIGRTSTLTVRVGSARVPLLRLGLGNARVQRDGLGVRASRVTASLTRQAASALNATFRVRAFRAGLRLGTVRTEVQPGQVVFAGGETRLALDAGAASALQSLGISAAPVDPAKANSDGRLAFPITGGRVNARTLAGSITHSGGIALTRGATRVELRSFTIGIDSSPALSALVGSDRVDILSLGVDDITREVEGRDVTVGGVTARLTKAAADALNQAFGTTAFTEGLTLGVAEVAGRAR